MDAIVAETAVVHAGLGVTRALGNYVRLGAVVAAGVALENDARAPSARADIIGRFLFDPLLQHRWGGYAGGGASLRYERGDQMRPRLLLLLGVEGQPVRGLMPALEVGLGGGVRLGIVLRRAVGDRR